jgi:glycosyltransferase involved in cell wall biosynthesis
MSNLSANSHIPALSITIPFYNPGVFFLPALQSVFAQTFADWELLLLDDGSTDGSLELAQSISDERVRVITDGTNRRQSYRANLGARLARAQYLFRMDADDIMHPDRLAVQLAALRSSSPETVVGTACYSIDKNARIVGWRPATANRVTGFAARYSFVNPSVAAPTEWFRKNPYSEEYLFRRAEDAELWCRTSSHTEFKWIPQPLLFYREVGVFSIDNYLAGEEAILDLIRNLEQDRARRWWLQAKERAKIRLFQGLAVLHCDNLIVRHRYRKVPPDQLKQAELAVRQVTQTVLPVR